MGLARLSPLCPRCLCKTQRCFQRDSWYCSSPVCGGFVTAHQMARTPRWRQAIGSYKRDRAPSLAAAWWRRFHVKRRRPALRRSFG